MILFVKRSSVTQLLPILALAKGYIDLAVTAQQGSINLLLPDLLQRIQGILEMLANVAIVPPSIAGMIANLLSMLQGMLAMLALPPVALSGLEQLAALQAALAELLAEIANLQAQLTITLPAVGFSAQLGAIFDAGFAAYGYQGAMGDMGAELNAAISGGDLAGFQASDQVIAIAFVAGVSNPADRAAFKFVFNQLCLTTGRT